MGTTSIAEAPASAPHLLGRFDPSSESTESRGYSALLWLATLWRDSDPTGADIFDGVARERTAHALLVERDRIRSAASMVATSTSRTSAHDGGFGARWETLVEAVDARESYDVDDIASVLGDGCPRTQSSQQLALEVLDRAVDQAVSACYWGSPSHRPVVATASAAHGETL